MKKLAVLFTIFLFVSLPILVAGCQALPPTPTPAPLYTPTPVPVPPSPVKTLVYTPTPLPVLPGPTLIPSPIVSLPGRMPTLTEAPILLTPSPKETLTTIYTPITPGMTLTPKPASLPKQTPVPIVWAAPSAPVTLKVDAAANRATYMSGGNEVPGFFYRPQGVGPFPALLVLHGRAGLSEGPQTQASWLATQGYVTLAPDYFTPIGMTREKFDASFYEKYVDRVREDLAQGLESLKSLPYVAPRRIGVVGFSLGGYLAFILGTRDDLKGIISYYGAYAPRVVARYPLADIITQIKAPVLMFHGDADQDVPIAHANTAGDLLISNSKQHEFILYPGVGHAFDNQGAPTFDAKGKADAQEKVLAFLKAKLQ